MSDNQTPATTPEGGAPGNQPPAGTPPASENQDGKTNPNDGGKKVEIDADELRRLKGRADRWDSYIKQGREERRNRHSEQFKAPENGDPELVQAFNETREQLTALQVENLTYKVKDKLISVMEQEDYKDLPDSFKRAILRNPLAFVDSRSKHPQDMVADIQDFMDEEIVRLESKTPAAAGDNKNPDPAGNPANQTPPVNGSGPSRPSAGDDYNIAGKTGSARSIAVLQGLARKAGLMK